jgi:hypothetical protein
MGRRRETGAILLDAFSERRYFTLCSDTVAEHRYFDEILPILVRIFLLILIIESNFPQIEDIAMVVPSLMGTSSPGS